MKNSIKKLFVICLSLMLMTASTACIFAAEAEVGDFTFNISYKNTADGDKVVGTQTLVVNGESGKKADVAATDIQIPEGYELDEKYVEYAYDFVPWDAVNTKDIYVKPVPVKEVKTELTVTFETVDGKKVGETKASTKAAGGKDESWTFMLGTDFQLPEGYQLAKGVDQVKNIQVPFGTTAGHTMIVEPIPAKEVKTELTVTFETVDGKKVGETKASTKAVGGKDESWTFMLGTDFQLPEGYQLAKGVDQVKNIQVPFGTTAGHTMIVEPIPAKEVKTELTVTFETVDGKKVGETKASTKAVGGKDESWTFMLGTDFQLPEGYQLAKGVDQVKNIQVPFGATAGHTMIVEPIPAKEVKTELTVTFETVDGKKVGETKASTKAVGGKGEAWTFMLGTDFQLPEGYQLAKGVDQVKNIQVPFGATAGHTMIVEPIPAKEVKTELTVTFETIYGEKVGETKASTKAVGGKGEAWTFMLGTDFQLPEGYQLAKGVDQVKNIDIPFGAVGGHTMIVEPIPAKEVKTELTVTFETVDGKKVGETKASTKAVGGKGEAWTFMLGTDFQLPEGYQLAKGVDQVKNIDIPFGAVGGHTMIVEKIPAAEEEVIAMGIVTGGVNGGLNVRKGPSTKYDKIGYLKKVTKIEIVEILSNGWYKIKYDGSYAYVSGKYSRILSAGIVTGGANGGLNVRKGPSTKYSKIGYLKKGAELEIVEKSSNGWYKIVYNGSFAYVSGKYVKLS